MRVIEPKQFQTIKAKKKKSSQHKLFKTLLTISALVVVVGLHSQGGLNYTRDNKTNNDKTIKEPSSEDSATKQKKLKKFTGDEFKRLYSSFAYPNTQTLSEKPSITGDDTADERIRRIAESRGYKLSSIPVANIAKTGETDLEGDDLIQPNALLAWRDMKAAARLEGITLQMTSAYRSIEQQRTLFLRRMQNDGVYTESVAAGYVDHLVEKLLTRVAPPGYSRHHTGYTIDLACDGIGLDAFTSTPCYHWLSKNNYENTKKYGWVPSYPIGVSLQGPEPEPWEYIWVSTYSLYE